MTKIKLQQFEGPLDLLLSLIEEQKLNITEISLAEVTEQFLQYVRQLEVLDPSSLADYLTIAAKLLVIKSKAILPSLEIEEEEAEEDETNLAEQLLAYKKYKEASKFLKSLDANRQQSFTRSLVFSERIHFWPDPAVDTELLKNTILKIVHQLKELENLPKAKIKQAVSMQAKISQLQGLLSSKVETKLSELLTSAKNKNEAIITFLALLELIKQRLFSVKQDDLFSDVTISEYQELPTEIIIEDDIEEESPELQNNLKDINNKQDEIEEEIVVNIDWDDDAEEDEEDAEEDDEDELGNEEEAV